MNEKTVIITETGDKYQLENNGISDFALIGILESILFEMKSANRREETSKTQNEPVPEPVEIHPVETSSIETPVKPQTEDAAPTAQEPVTPDIRMRINKAIEAIRGLGGEIENPDLGKMSDDELQAEFEALTNQYKRLKSTRAGKKS